MVGYNDVILDNGAKQSISHSTSHLNSRLKHPSKRTFQPSLEPILFQARALDMPAPARIPEQKVFLGARSTAVFPSSTAVFPSADSGISSLNTSTSGSRRSVRHTLIH